MAERDHKNDGEMTDEMRAHSRKVTLQQVVAFLNGSNKSLRTTAECREERRAILARGLLPHFNHGEQVTILTATMIHLEEMPCVRCRATAMQCTECGAVKGEGECRKS